MKNTLRALALYTTLPLLGLLCTPWRARANCNETPHVDAAATGNTVALDGWSDGVTILRENVTTGEVVFFVEGVDECVPPGTYRYGFETVDICYGCGRGRYFSEVTVTAALDAECTHSDFLMGSQIAMPYVGVPRWHAADGAILTEPVCPNNGICSTGAVQRANVLWLDAGAFAVGVAILLIRAQRRRTARRS